MSLFVTIALITMMLFLFSKETKTCLTKTLFNDDAADNETTRLWKNVRQILEKSQHYYYILAPKHCLENSLKTLNLTIWIFFQHYFRHLGSIYKILKVALGFFPLFQTHFIAWILHSYRNRWFEMCTSISCKKRGENCVFVFYCFRLF